MSKHEDPERITAQGQSPLEEGRADGASPSPTRMGVLGRNGLRLIAGLIACAAVGIAAFFYWHYAALHPSTNDAYVRADVVRIAPLVTGRVVEVNVDDNARVQAGDLLLRIDPAPFKAALDGAEARLRLARQEAKAAAASVAAATANLTQRQAELVDAERQTERVRALVRKGDAPKADGDDAQARLKTAQAAVAAAEATQKQAEEQLGATGNDNANVRAAAASVAQAELDLAHTKVTAPVTGVVGQVQIRPGAVAQAGIELFPLVDTSHWWVDANFKETDLARIRPGQPASVSVDIDPGRNLTGRVVSLSPASGVAFSLLPPENATGTWVKVTQRFPIRVALSVAPDDPSLGVGASASVAIDTSNDGGN